MTIASAIALIVGMNFLMNVFALGVRAATESDPL